jgi:hypothetical protein
VRFGASQNTFIVELKSPLCHDPMATTALDKEILEVDLRKPGSRPGIEPNEFFKDAFSGLYGWVALWNDFEYCIETMSIMARLISTTALTFAPRRLVLRHGNTHVRNNMADARSVDNRCRGGGIGIC